MNELLKSILDGIYSVVNNYGLSIIFFTLLIKMCQGHAHASGAASAARELAAGDPQNLDACVL